MAEGQIAAKQTSARRTRHVIVLKDRYPTSFVSPRYSRHSIHRTMFVPFNFVRSHWDGFTLLPTLRRADCVHAFNRIPFGASRLICSFESSLPRYYGRPPSGPIYNRMLAEITSTRCRRITALSHFAARLFKEHHRETEAQPVLEAKLFVRHPNVALSEMPDLLAGDPCESLKVTFVGGHFGRKGGIVMTRAARLSAARHLPIHFTIVSSLQMGEAVWFDPTVPGFFDHDVAALSLPNVTHFLSLPNAEARALMAQSHMTALPTFGDTFGYSMIESMAEHTPVIATNTCAVPEVVLDGWNGYLLDLDTDRWGNWRRPPYEERGTKAFADLMNETANRLAEDLVDRLTGLIGQPEKVQALRRNARATAEAMFSSSVHDCFWDDLYDRVSDEATDTPAKRDPVYDVSSPESPDFLRSRLTRDMAENA